MKQGASSRAERLEQSHEAAGPECGGEQAELSRSRIAACQARSHYLLLVIQRILRSAYAVHLLRRCRTFGVSEPAYGSQLKRRGEELAMRP